jgi:glycine hydroxymethyltransferase
MTDFLFRGGLSDNDAEVYQLIRLEDERQYRRLILIPSESTSPIAVRQALCSGFQNIYAEGYPDETSRKLTEDEILDYGKSLGAYRRFSSPRYYKGVEYANVIEALARRRCAETFAANDISADDIYVNVQPLSGAPANNAVYQALIKPGDTIMGMNLLHGGHLSHGSPAHRSGKLYKPVYYTINEETGQIDYEDIQNLANIHQPKLIIAGFSSYPWQADWEKFREIADSIGAYLLADISHVAGLIAGGVYPSPIGYAHVISSTTHKTLCGPRGAFILTIDKDLANMIDRAVFPGEQGGPHVNIISAMAVAFKLAQTDQFKQLQNQILLNSDAFAKRFEENGFSIPFGGTNTHILNLDMKSIKGDNDVHLTGDQAARILDLAGIVVNRNTIPGDHSVRNSSGIRMGSPWVTQRGFKEKDMIILADIISEILQTTKPYLQPSTPKSRARAKISFDILENNRIKVRNLALSAGIDFEPMSHAYPHFYYIDDQPQSDKGRVSLILKGDKITQFLNFALSNDIETLKINEKQNTSIYTPQEKIQCVIKKISDYEYQLSMDREKFNLSSSWLRDLSDGFIRFDDDLLRKLPGPVVVQESQENPELPNNSSATSNMKPYYIGIKDEEGEALPEFKWEETESAELKETPLNQIHRNLGAKMVPFAGWDMPVWYSSVIEEHTAVRQTAGLFDVSHMGVYQAEGPAATVFLDTVCGNDISQLEIGQSLYTHFLDPNSNVIDDLLVYRCGSEKYLLVVNASNDDKDWAWLNAVREGNVLIDRKRPWVKGYGRNVILRNLRDPQEGKDMRVDLALQGPKSPEILFSLGCDEQTKKIINKLNRTELCEAKIGKFELIVSRTGYTGERFGFELFVHPDKSEELWMALLNGGEPYGIKPCGLGARDSLRTEAGLPLYGHEMGGELNLSVGEAGFRTYVKTYKPWFIGRDAFLVREAERRGKVIRFRFDDKGVRIAHLGDPVVDKRGKTIGFVTSCAIDSEGFLTGQAYLEEKYAKIGTPIMIFQNAPDTAGIPPANLKTGDRVSIPNGATIISRFIKQ